MDFKGKISVICNGMSRRTASLLLLFFFLLFSFESSALAIKPASKLARNLKALAIHFDRNDDATNAADYYLKYLALVKDDAKMTCRLADLFFRIRDYINAEKYYDTVINLNSVKYPLSYYRKGIVCMNLEKYDEAVESFAKFKKFYRVKGDKSNFKKLAVLYSANCIWAKNNATPDKRITVAHEISLSHADIDFAPFPVSESMLYFGSAGTEQSGQLSPSRQIYRAEKVDSKWKNVEKLNDNINDPEFNSGNAAISPDGNTMYFTRSRKNWQDKIISELFVSHMSGGEWQAVEKLPYPVNIENYTSTQPAIGKNLRNGNLILYFVSDRPGGRGGLDIWYTEYDNKLKTYRNPANLPNKVNSIGDDCSPFFDNSTQSLYFSSRGRKNGYGGFDIYKSSGSLRKWTEALPLPIPVNSSYDDYFYSVLNNNKEGFFTSNRPGSMKLDNGTCCDDIYSFLVSECGTIYSRGTVRNSTNYDIYDLLNSKYHLGLKYPENNAPLTDVQVELYIPEENDNDAILVGKTTTDENGSFHFELDKEKNYKVLVKNYGYFEKKMAVNTFSSKCSDTINIGTALIPFLPKVTIQVNVYYEFNKYNLTEKARQTIDSMMLPLFDIFPNGVVEIGSHTDSIGTEVYNMDLSQKRSESVVSYLISKGISSERLVAKGYGMSMPIAPNKNRDGSDNPEGRQLNRRTEMKIVGDISKFNNNE
jgi:OmpA-OmpF porin, OOP family